MKDSTQCAPNGYYFVPVYDKVWSSFFCFSIVLSFHSECYKILRIAQLPRLCQIWTILRGPIISFHDIAGYSIRPYSGTGRVVFRTLSGVVLSNTPERFEALATATYGCYSFPVV